MIEEGTGRSMRVLKRPLAGKTGTTNDLRDAWFVGFSPQLICGVWVGQDDNRPLGKRETGARAAGPIWREFMGQALKGQPAEDFPVPDGVVFVRVDRDSGAPGAAGGKGGFFESFKQGRQPPARPGAGPAVRADKPKDFLQSPRSFGAPPAAAPEPVEPAVSKQPSEPPYSQDQTETPPNR